MYVQILGDATSLLTVGTCFLAAQWLVEIVVTCFLAAQWLVEIVVVALVTCAS